MEGQTMYGSEVWGEGSSAACTLQSGASKYLANSSSAACVAKHRRASSAKGATAQSLPAQRASGPRSCRQPGRGPPAQHRQLTRTFSVLDSFTRLGDTFGGIWAPTQPGQLGYSPIVAPHAPRITPEQCPAPPWHATKPKTHSAALYLPGQHQQGEAVQQSRGEGGRAGEREHGWGSSSGGQCQTH